MKKCPIIFALLGVATIWVGIRVLPRIDCGALTLGVHEGIAAVFVLLVYWLLAGNRDLKPNPTGFGYGFRVMKYLYIILMVFALGGLVAFEKLVGEANGAASYMPLVNAFVTCLFVGIVEEFTFRGMVFGGLASCFGRSKKGVILAAAISGVLFGFIHVANEVFSGQIATGAATAQVIGKTIQAGLIGFIFALIYFRVRSIWAVALMHGLYDLCLFIATASGGTEVPGYVITKGLPAQQLAIIATAIIVLYFLFSLLAVPAIVRVIRDILKDEEPCILPMDEDFLPRKMVYVKPNKRKRA